MKKTISILLTFILMLLVTACSGQENSPSIQQAEPLQNKTSLQPYLREVRQTPEETTF